MQLQSSMDFHYTIQEWTEMYDWIITGRKNLKILQMATGCFHLVAILFFSPPFASQTPAPHPETHRCCYTAPIKRRESTVRQSPCVAITSD